MKYINNNWFGLINLFCGLGKTKLALYTMALK
jgi:hypothetical protein